MRHPRRRGDTQQEPCGGRDADGALPGGEGSRLSDDSWASAETALSRHLREHPDVERIASHLGLANVPQADALLRELRRVGRELVSTHVFYRDDDERNLAAARDLDLDTLATKSAALAALADADWSASVDLECEVKAEPTPVSELVAGVAIDGLPVAPAVVTWCVLVAR